MRCCKPGTSPLHPKRHRCISTAPPPSSSPAPSSRPIPPQRVHTDAVTRARFDLVAVPPRRASPSMSVRRREQRALPTSPCRAGPWAERRCHRPSASRTTVPASRPTWTHGTALQPAPDLVLHRAPAPSSPVYDPLGHPVRRGQERHSAAADLVGAATLPPVAPRSKSSSHSFHVIDAPV
jgi:hypothetical protein